MSPPSPSASSSTQQQQQQQHPDDTRTQRYRTEDVQSDAGSFADLLLPAPLVQALAAAGFVRPSPVQKAAIPIGRVGTDLIVQAKSGTGKTAVFATILLDRVDLEVSTPQAIVVAPTRELAIQSYQVIERVSAHLPQPAPSAAVFVGGLPTADDEKRLRRVCHIAVGTPGRLCSLITSGYLLVNKIKAVVLDEADQLLGEGFYADTAWLLQQLPSSGKAKKQVLAFSATYTQELLGHLEPLMRRSQKVLLCEETVSLLGIRQFYKVVVGSPAGTGSSDSSQAAHVDTSSSSAPTTSAAAAAAPQEPLQTADSQSASEAGSPTDAAVAKAQQAQQEPQQQSAAAGEQQQPPAELKLSVAEQQALLVLKVDALLQLLSSVSFHQAVVFCNRKPTAEWLARRLTAAGCPSAHLSSDLPQTERMAAMESVRTFKVRIIVSTDVMARGVDFDRVNLVVNIDLPPDSATYVHRVGRTGRFGSRGIAVALVTQQELNKLQQYLADVKGGDISPLPAVIPSDLYSFDLDSEWEKEAYQQLLAAPTSTPPDSPPPLRKKKAAAAVEQHGEQGQAAGGNAASAAAAAAFSAFGYDESALSCFDWGEDEEGDSVGVGQQQQEQQQGQGLAAAAAGQAGSAAEGAAEYDAAAAWEAWAAYYRSLGYDYQHPNPYLTAGAAGCATAPPASPPTAAAAANGVAAPGGGAEPSKTAATAAAAEQHLPQHRVLFEDEVEEEEDEGWELPSEDEIDDRARMLLSRLHVTQEAAALAQPVEAQAAAEGAGGGDGDVVQQQPCGHTTPPAQQQQQQQQESSAAGEPVCWQCWSAEYTAWQQRYAAWQQQFSAWCDQYQQQQHQQWQHYSSWCEAYSQQQQRQQSQTASLAISGCNKPQ